MENKEITCPKCKSAEIVKRGTFESIAHGIRQRYYCKSCHKKFIEQDGFYRMRNSPQKITCAIDLFYRGVSTRKIQEHFEAFYPHNSSHKSIYKWIIKYSRIISRFTDNLKIKPIREVQIDEMEVGSRRSRYNGWFIDNIDTETRFMVASEFKKHRDLKEVKQVLSQVKRKTENQVSIVTSDGWHTPEQFKRYSL